jgi:putative nucleotidyltransferase with HDIG domain
VLARDRSWQVDVTPLMGGTLAEDLARRDFTVNALARPIDGGELIDLHGGVEDLRARRLRMVGDASFAADPLRVVRLARFAVELEFQATSETLAAAVAAAPQLVGVAPERVFSELRMILCAEAPAEGLRLLERAGAAAAVLPELEAVRGIEQSAYHHLDVHDHTLEVLERTVALAADPGEVFAEWGETVSRRLAEPLANELTRGQALRLGALFHDLAKPATRAVTPEGRVTFLGHDAEGAELAARVLGRLRASERLIAHVAALTRHHLRLGFLVHEAPLGPRAIYRYLSACDPVQVDVTLLSVADRLATRGRGAETAIDRHLAVAREVIGPALSWEAEPPRPPIRGDVLARSLSIAPGPDVGRLLGELTEAAYVGEVHDEDQAVAWARQALARQGSPSRGSRSSDR